MRRREVKLALRAAGRITREREFFLIGSQAVHAYCARPPAEVTLSQECDLCPRNRPETAHRLDVELGRGSRFARRHGFYVDVVTPELASLPTGWERRLRPLRAELVTAWCLEVHGLIVTKLAADRLKDLEFVGALFHLGLAAPRTVGRRLRRLSRDRDRARLRARLQAVLDDLGGQAA